MLDLNEDTNDDKTSNSGLDDNDNDNDNARDKNYELDDEDIDNWQDFDIQTLNFDKFIKEQFKENEPNSSSATNAESSSKNNRNKRRKEDSTTNSGNEEGSETKVKRRRNKFLPIEIQGLMGEANLCYARGETNKAIDICLEVIKYAPKAPEPYQLLSLLYSEIGENDKALRVGLVSAQLNKDQNEWIQLIQQAIIEVNPLIFKNKYQFSLIFFIQ
jgi:tetratricopeptide (TPR) repeat protein